MIRDHYVGCIILSKNRQIVLQQRPESWVGSFPGCLATFGGRIEEGESPVQALIRELHEELGAEVRASDVLFLGKITESVTQHQDVIHLYFWHDEHGTITGCYEGEARYYDTVDEALALLQCKMSLKVNTVPTEEEPEKE